MADQQFCLRWNNHQNTLISVFDTLLAGEILVDCTLAAEGKFLRAHKVVLSACSPFFSDILRQHYEQHPILIMKDVKFEQLKAMLDYMYRGEVNISQDQLGTFLKAAESLQIKGLSDSAPSDKLPSKQKVPSDSRALCLSSKPDDDLTTSRSSNLSPLPRRKKRRRPSGSGDEVMNEESPSEQLPDDSIPPPSKISVNSRLSNPSSPLLTSTDENAPPPEEASRLLQSKSHSTSLSVYSKSESLHQQLPPLVDSVLFEPKSECIELDDEESLGHDEDAEEAGPSHCKSDAGGFSWQMDRPEDSFHPQESLSGQQSAQGRRKQNPLKNPAPVTDSSMVAAARAMFPGVCCENCGRRYKYRSGLTRHQLECKAPTGIVYSSQYSTKKFM